MANLKEKIRRKWSTERVEPELPKDYTKYDLINALSWYNIMTDSRECHKYVTSYLKKRKIAKIITAKDSIQTAAAIARLIDRNQITDDHNLKWMDNWVSGLDDKVEIKKDPDKKTVSIQEATANKLNLFIEGLDNAVDDFIFESDFKMKFSTEKYLANGNVKFSMLKGINDWATSFRNEIVLSKTDKDLKEGYSNFTTPQKNKIIKFLDNIIDGIEVYGSAIKPVRTRKVKSPSKLVEKLKFQKNFPQLKLNSVSPDQLINAKEVWTYNSATRMLSYFTSESGMTVSGTTMKGFDISEQRRLKKPADQLPKFIKSRKGQWIKGFKSIDKTVVTKANGRFNGTTLILKVFS